MSKSIQPPNLDEVILDFEMRKRQFEQWRIQNLNAQGTSAYDTYVTNFQQYEKEMNKKIAELKNAIPLSVIREDLDTQLHSMLRKCNKEQFFLAFLHATNKDDGLFTAVKTAIENLNTPKNVPTLINSYGTVPLASSSTAMSSPLQIQGSPGPVSFQIRPPPRVQMTPYGVVPEGWIVEPPIVRQEQLAPPPRTYAEASKLPFFDIGGGK